MVFFIDGDNGFITDFKKSVDKECFRRGIQNRYKLFCMQGRAESIRIIIRTLYKYANTQVLEISIYCSNICFKFDSWFDRNLSRKF